jgi:hypothetical protein
MKPDGTDAELFASGGLSTAAHCRCRPDELPLPGLPCLLLPAPRGSTCRGSMAGLNCPRASGVRYTPAFDWSPEVGAKLGDNMAWDELNMAEEAGQFFGFPLCHR